jgi:hypothetical protein
LLSGKVIQFSECDRQVPYARQGWCGKPRGRKTDWMATWCGPGLRRLPSLEHPLAIHMDGIRPQRADSRKSNGYQSPAGGCRRKFVETADLARTARVVLRQCQQRPVRRPGARLRRCNRSTCQEKTCPTFSHFQSARLN